MNLVTAAVLDEGLKVLLERDEDQQQTNHMKATVTPVVAAHLGCQAYINTALMPVVLKLLEEEQDPDKRGKKLAQFIFTVFQVGAFVGLQGGIAQERDRQDLQRPVV